MRLILPSQKEPLSVNGPQMFVDWRYVSEGAINWRREGKNLGTWTEAYPLPTPEASYPHGIRLEAEKATIVGPLFPLDKPWEQGYLMYVNTVLYDEGKYRMWYTVVPPDHRGNRNLDWHIDIGWVLCYAESDDGFTWTKPDLGLATYEGEPTNWVYGRQLSPNAFASGAVFKDPSAPPAERYKVLYRAEEKHADMAAWLERQRDRFDGDMDPKATGGKPGQGGTAAPTAGAVSPDGIHWTPLADPIMMYCSDQMNTAFWDEDLGRYVGYFRMQRAGRRSVGRSETTDFSRWPTPYPCLEVPLDWLPSDDIMHCPALTYPGSPNTYLMFATLFHRSTDCRDVHLATSADGLSWQWLPGEYVATGADSPPDWKFEEITAGYGIVPLSGDRIGVPVVGYEFPYKHPRWVGGPLGAPGYATWPKNRLSAIVADGEGEFVTHKLKFDGRALSLNLKTARAGSVLVELRDAKGAPIPGHTFADASPLSGDRLDQHVAWNGSLDLSSFAGQTLSLAFQLRAARLYAFEFCR